MQHRWAIDKDIPLGLVLVDPTGAGASGLSPQVSIRRHRALSGAALDNYFWTGAAFQASPAWLSMAELDATNSPGVYTYLFAQNLIALEQTYLVVYRCTAGVIGTDFELHEVTQDLRRLDELHKLQGLATGSPMQVSPTARTVGSVSLAISKVGSVVTVERQ